MVSIFSRKQLSPQLERDIEDYKLEREKEKAERENERLRLEAEKLRYEQEKESQKLALEKIKQERAKISAEKRRKLLENIQKVIGTRKAGQAHALFGETRRSSKFPSIYSSLSPEVRTRKRHRRKARRRYRK